MTTRFHDFGELYRAAFAEPNLDTKQLLLADVQKALDRWADTVREGMPSPAKPGVAEISDMREAAAA
jgi:hypothetical protein